MAFTVDCKIFMHCFWWQRSLLTGWTACPGERSLKQLDHYWTPLGKLYIF